MDFWLRKAERHGLLARFVRVVVVGLHGRERVVDDPVVRLVSADRQHHVLHRRVRLKRRLTLNQRVLRAQHVRALQL